MSSRDDETKSSAELVRRGLRLGEGFGLYVVAAEQLETRASLIRALTEDPALAVAVVDVAELRDAAIDGPIEGAERSLAPSERRKVVVVTGVEALTERVPELMARINEHRNELRARVGGALVLLGTPELLGLVQHQAPDLWSARAADIELAEAPPSWLPPPLQPLAGNGATAAIARWQRELEDMPSGDRRGRLALRTAEALEREEGQQARARALYEQAAQELEVPLSRALALVHAAGLEDRSRGEEALVAAETALRRLDEDAGPPEIIARAWSGLGRVWQARGRLDEAEEAVRRALHLAEQSDVDEVRAVVWAGQAELLTSLGSLHEALALWDQTLSLPQPVLARLGALVRAGVTAALAGRRDRLDRDWGQYLARGGRPQQLEVEIDALDGAAATLARDVVARP